MQDDKRVIPLELAEQIADALSAAGYDSPYSNVYGSADDPKPICDYVAGMRPVKFRREGYTFDEFVSVHQVIGKIAPQFGELPQYWSIDVAKVMTERRTTRMQAETRAAIEALNTTSGMRARLLADFDETPHCRRPTVSNLSGLVRMAHRETDQWGKKRAPWVCDPSCTCRLRLSHALQGRYSQGAYADYSIYYVPFEGEVTDETAAAKRLGEFFRRADTHTGWAGSGANYSLGGFDLANKLVILNIRASISD